MRNLLYILITLTGFTVAMAGGHADSTDELHKALNSNSFDRAYEILELGADPKMKNSLGRHAIESLFSFFDEELSTEQVAEHYRMLEVLTSKGVSLNDKDKNGIQYGFSAVDFYCKHHGLEASPSFKELNEFLLENYEPILEDRLAFKGNSLIVQHSNGNINCYQQFNDFFQIDNLERDYEKYKSEIRR